MSSALVSNLATATDSKPWRTIGIEVERWASPRKRRYRPADLSELVPLFADLEKEGRGRILREPGPGSIEFAGHFSHSVEEAAAHVRFLAEAVTGRFGLDIVSQVQSPFHQDPAGPSVAKSRYRALWDALSREVAACGGTPEDAALLNRMNRFAATHAHFQFEGHPITHDRVDERIVFVINVLNFVGPRIARIISKRYGQRNEGHLGIWHGWADPRRFTAYDMWFESFSDMRSRFESLPRLVRCTSGDKETGDWEADLTNRLSWANPDDDGSGWWHFVRARPRLGTFEVRLLPSLPDHVLEPAIRVLDDFVCFLVSVAHGGVGFRSLGEFRDSPLWREIALRPVGAGGLRIPSSYNEVGWREDVF